MTKKSEIALSLGCEVWQEPAKALFSGLNGPPSRDGSLKKAEEKLQEEEG